MNIVLVLGLLLAVSYIEILLSSLNAHYGLVFAFASAAGFKLHPALIILPVLLISAQVLFFSCRDFRLRRLTEEARRRRGFCEVRCMAYERRLRKRIRQIAG